MFSVGLSSSVSLNKSTILKRSTTSKQGQFTVKCSTNSNGVNPSDVAASVNNFTIAGVSKTKTDLQTSCAILSTGNLPKPITNTDTCPSPMRVAYQGVPGAYSEAAASNAYPNGEFIPCDQFEAAFQAVELWLADRAVLPLENSLGGSIHRNYDLLLWHRLHIVGEVQLPVRHCLLALRDTAAIASERAAKIYGLDVLCNGIHDDSNNVTRFVMLAREPIIPHMHRPFRTSIVFAHDNSTAVLFKVLSAFAFRNINLTKIESRPHRIRPITFTDKADIGTVKQFEYLFYVDIDASMADVRAQNALSEVQEFTSFLRVLGSYPIDMTPWSPSGGEL